MEARKDRRLGYYCHVQGLPSKESKGMAYHGRIQDICCCIQDQDDLQGEEQEVEHGKQGQILTKVVSTRTILCLCRVWVLREKRSSIISTS